MAVQGFGMSHEQVSALGKIGAQPVQHRLLCGPVEIDENVPAKYDVHKTRAVIFRHQVETPEVYFRSQRWRDSNIFLFTVFILQ